MKGYKLIKEHATHFEVSHPKDGPFKVAKHGLDDALIGRIQALPKHMDDGGDVGPPAPLPPEPMYSDSGVVDFLTGNAGPGGSGPSALGAAADQVAPVAKAVVDAGRPLPPPADMTSAPGDAAPDDAGQVGPPPPNPNAAGGAPADPGASGGAGAGGAGFGSNGMMPGMGQMLGKISGDYGAIAGGIRAGADVAGKQGDAAAAALQSQTDGLKAINDDYTARRKAIDTDQAQLEQSFANGKIDPNRVWSNMSTGNKVVAGISVLLAGIGSGLSGQPNAAMAVINNAIDKDIDAQKANLGKTHSLLAMNMQKYQNLDTATAMTRAQLISATQSQIQTAAAKSQGPAAQAAATQAIGQLNLQKDQYLGGAAMQMNQMGIKNGVESGQIDPNQIPRGYLEQMYPGQVVNVPGAGVRVANTPDDAKKVKDIQEAGARLQGQIAKMKAFNAQEGGIGTITGSANNELAKAMQAETIPMIQEFNGLTRLSDTDKGLDESMIANPGTFRSKAFTKVIDNLSASVNSRANAAYGQRLKGFNPGGNAARTTPLSGK